MISLKFKTIFLLALSSAHAQTAPDCGVPPFGNTKVTIANSAVRYALEGNEVKVVTGLVDGSLPTWQFELTEGYFRIHPTADLSMSIQISDTGLQISKTQASEVKQKFLVNCARDCVPDSFFLGDGCNIFPASDKTKCLQAGDGPGAGSSGDSITVETCAGIDAQRYNFENEGAGVAPPPLEIVTPPACGAPDYQNLKVTIANSALKYTVSGTDVIAGGGSSGDTTYQEWVFEKSSNFFFIHPAGDLTKSIQAADSGVHIATASPNEIKQQFIVDCKRDCDTAPDGFFIGDGCRISAVSDSTKCLQVGDGVGPRSDGDPILLETCAVSDAQQYNFENQGVAEVTTPVTPPPADAVCGVPDYQNLKVTIANSALKYTVSGTDVIAGDGSSGDTSNQEWVFEKSNTFFLIHPSNDLTKSIQSSDHGLQLVDAVSFEVKQQFRVNCKRDCDTAPDGFFIGDGCTISAVTDTTKCLQVGDGVSPRSDGDLILLETCNGSDSQQYNFENKGVADSVCHAPGYQMCGSGKTLLSGAISDDDAAESSSMDKWGPIIVGLLAANLIATLILAGLSVFSFMRAGKTASSPKYAPVKTGEEHVPFGYPTVPYKDEEPRYSDPHA